MHFTSLGDICLAKKSVLHSEANQMRKKFDWFGMAIYTYCWMKSIVAGSITYDIFQHRGWRQIVLVGGLPPSSSIGITKKRASVQLLSMLFSCWWAHNYFNLVSPYGFNLAFIPLTGQRVMNREHLLTGSLRQAPRWFKVRLTVELLSTHLLFDNS